jgi:hypothetical protein
MSFSEEKVHSLISKIENDQARSRKRSILAVFLPTVVGILYLGITLWLINVKQNELKGLDKSLATRTEELTQTERKLVQKKKELEKLENAFSEQNNQVKQVQQEIAQGNLEAAQEQIVNINTDFRSQERDGFHAILKGDLEQARRLFGNAYRAYPTYHNVDEIYHQLLSAERVKTYNSASGASHLCNECKYL